MPRRSRREERDLGGRRDRAVLESRLEIPAVRAAIDHAGRKAATLSWDDWAAFNKGVDDPFAEEWTTCRDNGVSLVMFDRAPFVRTALTGEGESDAMSVRPDPASRGRYMKFTVDMGVPRSQRIADFADWQEDFDRWIKPAKPSERRKRRSSSQRDLEALDMLRQKLDGKKWAEIARGSELDPRTISRRVVRFCSARGLPDPRTRGVVLDGAPVGTDCDNCPKRVGFVLCTECLWPAYLKKLDAAETPQAHLPQGRTT